MEIELDMEPVVLAAGEEVPAPLGPDELQEFPGRVGVVQGDRIQPRPPGSVGPVLQREGLGDHDHAADPKPLFRGDLRRPGESARHGGARREAGHRRPDERPSSQGSDSSVLHERLLIFHGAASSGITRPRDSRELIALYDGDG